MKLTPPKKVTFFISVALLVVGLVLTIAGQAAIGFWITFVGGALLALGNCMKGF
ncbi:MAG: hypothetical protein VB021_03610 [Oscillospiraceae bacterium]|nr:hypothetical protein [Oscillospiraceae bacterium]